MLDAYRAKLAGLHSHVCPRQILGLRMGMLAGELLGLGLPQTDKRLLAFVETDGCFADGVMVATGCAMGHRTMRLVDEGKIAAVFVDTQTGDAIRIWPAIGVRGRAAQYAPGARSRWHAQLEAYQRMRDTELLAWRRVTPTVDLRAIISRNGVRVTCEHCGEEIINGRERQVGESTLCISCAGSEYFRYVADSRDVRIAVLHAQKA
ncbi:MAG: FmdE family protein [Thermoflexales bacterium]